MDVEALIEQLTLEEKVSLTAEKPRRKLVAHGDDRAAGDQAHPALRRPNGVRGTRFFDSTPSACLPCGTAIGATFDVDLVHRLGQLLADEAHAKGAHVLLGPTINTQRGPLGGRGFESYSEDPVLSGILAGHYVRGVQESGVSATLKHFVCNDLESERMAVNALVTDRAMREIYLLPFMIAIEMGRPRAIMTAYNKVNGVHAAESKAILQDILRGEWGWDGLVMSDWFGTYSTAEAIKAGLDLEMPGPSRWRAGALSHAIMSNKVKVAELDAAVRNVLRLVKHGLENTSIPPNAPETEADTPAHAALLREAAAKSLVLLKNEGGILPFDRAKTVAVIGPNANIATYCGGGSAGLRAYRAVTPLEGVRSLVGGGGGDGNDNSNGKVFFSQGAYGHQSLPLLGKALTTPDGKHKGFVLRIYNDPPPRATERAADGRSALEERVLDDANIWFVDYENAELAPVWWAETEGVLVPERSGEWDFGLSVHGTGELYIDGELVVSNVEDQRLGSSFLGCGTVEEVGSKRLEAGRSYRVLVRFGCSATTKLKASGTVDFGQGGVRFSGCPRLEPAAAIREAVEAARSADQVVVCTGLSGEWESEGFDRTTMALPPGTDDLVAAVLAANPNTAVVVQSGTPVAMPWIDRAGAVLHAWFGGNEAGNGIADVLFGEVNPISCAQAGKLPLTMPRRVADNPAALSFRSDNGRVLYSEDVYVGYRWYDTLDVEPLFPFGHGLSYTTFELSDLEVFEAPPAKEANGYTNGHTNGHTNASDTLVVRARVTNTGPRAGAEVVQVYVTPAAPTPLTSSTRDAITRPAKEMKGFARVSLEAGASGTAEVALDVLRATSYWSEMEDCWRSDAGTYGVLPGRFLEETVVVEKTRRWKGLRA
ncbi:betaglucosidase [Colletotrichum higginsianum]|nr:betaglucosidase [Colletotrichum higginsianum]